MNKIETFIISLILIYSCLPLLASDEYVSFDFHNPNTDEGIYRVSTNPESKVEKIAELYEFGYNCVVTNDILYFFSDLSTHTEIGGWDYQREIRSYDILNKYTRIDYINAGESFILPRESAFDPITENVYSIFDIDGNYKLGTLCPDTGRKNLICPVTFKDQKPPLLAFSPDGELYGLSKTGKFMHIDKDNGSISYLSNDFPKDISCMIFSEDGKTLYAIQNDPTNDYPLFSINTKTGGCSKIKNIGIYANLIWRTPFSHSPLTPGFPSDIKVHFMDRSLSGVISFLAPSTDKNGTELSGDIMFSVYANGRKVAEGITHPGQITETGFSVKDSGYYTIKVVMSNSYGTGNSDKVTNVWAGFDISETVRNLQLTKADDNTYVLNWDPPVKGIYGGYFDPSALSYRITRHPDEVVVSEDAVSPYTDTFYSETPIGIYYSVTPYYEDVMTGMSKNSNIVVAGDSFTPPFFEGFDSYESENQWVTEDSNIDGHTWAYTDEYNAMLILPGSKGHDDWLISPRISLKQDHQYKFSFDVKTWTKELMEVMLGTSDNPDDMSLTLIPPTILNVTKFDWETISADLKAPRDGVYQIGFHAITAPSGCGLIYIDNVAVDSTENLRTTESDEPSSEEIWTLQGIKVNCPRESLPSGVYIISGKKVMINKPR